MKSDSMERFETEWRARASRPADLPPADAARQVLDRIDREAIADETVATRRSTHASWRGLVAMAASLAIVATLAWLLPSRWHRAHVRSPEAMTVVAGHDALEAPRNDTDVVLFWLDRDTPLYMTMRPSRGETP